MASMSTTSYERLRLPSSKLNDWKEHGFKTKIERCWDDFNREKENIDFSYLGSAVLGPTKDGGSSGSNAITDSLKKKQQARLKMHVAMDKIYVEREAHRTEALAEKNCEWANQGALRDLRKAQHKEDADERDLIHNMELDEIRYEYLERYEEMGTADAYQQALAEANERYNIRKSHLAEELPQPIGDVAPSLLRKLSSPRTRGEEGRDIFNFAFKATANSEKVAVPKRQSEAHVRPFVDGDQAADPFPNKIAAHNRIIARSESACKGKQQPLQRSASDDMRQAMAKYEAKKKPNNEGSFSPSYDDQAADPFPNKIAAHNRIIAHNERARKDKQQPLQRSASDDMRQAMAKYEAKKKAAAVVPKRVVNHSFGSGPASLVGSHLDGNGKVKRGWKKKKNRVNGSHFYENGETGEISHPLPKAKAYAHHESTMSASSSEGPKTGTTLARGDSYNFSEKKEEKGDLKFFGKFWLKRRLS